MSYYEVWVAAQGYHGHDPLTYSSDASMQPGAIVQVPLQNKMVMGVVRSEVQQPSFKTKPLATLPEETNAPAETLGLIDWLISYYPAPTGQIASLFVPTNLATKSRAKTEPESKTPKVPSLPPLTKDQSAALTQIRNNKSVSCLLHGDTGTGKTRVYLELAKECIDKGQSVIVLTPEIGLTPQLVSTFSSQFPNQTIVTHSHMTTAQRRDIWLRIAHNKKPQIIIGPRSALFSPVRNLGLVVVDECHDGAYKQEQAPHYLTTRVAAQLAKLHGAKLVLGSATPNVADYYAFEAKNLPIIRMTEPAVDISGKLEEIAIVPIRERDNFKRSAWLSDKLLDGINQSLQSENQSLLFLNRRGSARIVLCQNCDWQALCPKCDIPLTYHADSHSLRCHTCGYKASSPSSCPVCKAVDIVYKSIGTKALFEEVSKLFPEARVARFDSDNLKSERLDQNDQSVREGKFDILVGTQTLIKGLDLPKLSFVGVVAADTALYFPDFSSEEIAFQQISQVVGRVGRGHVAGSVVIQTYYPENSALKAIADKNYSLFYKQQISERERFLFPPFSYLLRLSCGRKNSSIAEKASQKLRTFIEDLHLSVEIIGPAPSFKHKQNDTYHWQLVIKSKKREHLTSIIRQLPTQTSYDIDPINLL